MNRLVLHHTYDDGLGFDVSENGNHGTLSAVAPGGTGYERSLRFNGGPSRVSVDPARSLDDLRSIRTHVRFQYTPQQPGAGRHNLIEGHLSFALFIHPDASLQGTILDRNGAWRGPQSAAGIVSANVWHEAELVHDGISEARLYLDGNRVGAMSDVPGPVRSVAQSGIAVGHWPDPDDRYTLEGYVDDVKLWCYDPAEDIRRLIDLCCLDRRGLDRIVASTRAEGWDAERLTPAIRDILDLGAEIAEAARSGEPERATRARALTREGMLAITQRDPQLWNAFFERMRAYAEERLTSAELEAFGKRALAQLQALPIELEQLPELARILCWERLLPPRDDREQPEPPRPEQQPDDPDTDWPDEQPPPGWDDDVEDIPDDAPVIDDEERQRHERRDDERRRRRDRGTNAEEPR